MDGALFAVVEMGGFVVIFFGLPGLVAFVATGLALWGLRSAGVQMRWPARVATCALVSLAVAVTELALVMRPWPPSAEMGPGGWATLLVPLTLSAFTFAMIAATAECVLARKPAEPETAVGTDPLY